MVCCQVWSLLFCFQAEYSISTNCPSSSRSIWTCAHQQSSIPPASLTPAAPAPLVTTLCFPTTRYRMSPVSPSTSTSTEMSKHEPMSAPFTPVWPTPLDVWNHAPSHHHSASSRLMDPGGIGLVAALLSSSNTATHKPIRWSQDVFNELTGILQLLFFLSEWTSSSLFINFYMWFSCL